MNNDDCGVGVRGCGRRRLWGAPSRWYVIGKGKARVLIAHSLVTVREKVETFLDYFLEEIYCHVIIFAQVVVNKSMLDCNCLICEEGSMYSLQLF